MTKLLAAYLAAPTLNNALKLRTYNLKHPFASCLLTFEDKEVLDSAIRHVKAMAKAERAEQAAYEAELAHYGRVMP